MALEVTAGGEVTADMRVTRSMRYRVGGRVVDSRTGAAPDSAFVALSQNFPTGESSGTSRDSRSGVFEFQGVIPGTYTLGAQIPQRSTAAFNNSIVEEIAADLATPKGRVFVDVSGNLADVVITISLPGSIEGRLTLNGEPLSNLPDLDRIHPGLRPFALGGTIPIGPSANIAADGTFHLGGISEDDYKFGITGVPAGFYVEKAEMGTVDLLRDSSHLSPPLTGTLDVVLRRGVGEVRGTVTDAQSRPAPGVQVVLVPDERLRLDLYATSITNKSGVFTMTNVPPGNYRVFSWESLAPYGYFNPDVLSRDESFGQPVRVTGSSGFSVEVRTISAER